MNRKQSKQIQIKFNGKLDNYRNLTAQKKAPVKEFENRFSDFLNTPAHSVMVNSGSSANYLAVEVLGLEKGDEVITPALTFSTTVAPLLKFGLKPAFVDVIAGTYNTDVDKVEELITDKTKALMIPNLLGNIPDWDVLNEIADKHNLKIVEDSADTLGGTLRGQSTGQYSDISTTSFYLNIVPSYIPIAI